MTWTTTEVYPWTAFSGQAGSSIDLGQLMSFVPGQTYLLAFYVGPNGSSVYLPFIYGLDAEVSISNQNIDYFTLVGTIYGDIEVPIIPCGRLELDGSESKCENSYQVIIESFDPIFPNWNTTTDPGEVYNEWFNTTAPSLITIPANVFPSDYTGYYLLTFAVGPTWTPEYILFWYDCENAENRSSKNITSLEEKISVHPNPTKDLVTIKTNFIAGRYHIYDMHGKLVNQSKITSTESSIDLSGLNAGIYFFRIQSDSGEVHFKKVVKN